MKELDLLIEVGVEEIPAGYIAPALAALEERLTRVLNGEARLAFSGDVRTWATPRRIAFAVRGLSAHQADVTLEKIGPPAKAAFDGDGNPTKAAVGFAKGQGVDVSDLEVVETDSGPRVTARKEIKGRPAEEVLPEVLPPLILGLPFPKSMRWGKGEVTFVRPVHWVLALLGGTVLDMELGGIKASNASCGHRFLHPDPVEVRSVDEYEETLGRAHVVVSTARREEIVREEIARAVAEADEELTVLPDEALVIEVANLVEEPVVCLGGFDEVFLSLPQDVVTTAMREHQRYFAVTDPEGRLRPYFLAVNNTRARDMGVVARGHERVLRARLDDARFYFEDDRKTSLESKRSELERVVFHKLLGTSWQKVERFTRLAGYLADRLEPEAKPNLLRAAALCKCDLVTGVVGEFPSLQGVMGREYALLDGEPTEVAEAIYEHYMPVRAEGGLPQTPAGALLSLADKMDTIAGCFGVGLLPTGAADPFALRRQALGIINIILDRGYRLSLGDLTDHALIGVTDWLKRPADEVKADILEFFRLRLKNQFVSRGASTDGAEAVLTLHHDDLVSAAARVWALEEIKVREDFNDLAVAFKRVVNIIKKFGDRPDFDPARVVEDQEKALLAAVESVENRAETLVGADDYKALLGLIVALKSTVDDFFDHVLVDDPDPEVKNNRLALLTRVARLFARIADFSKIST